MVLLAVVYFGAARLGLLMAIPGTNVSPVWPPTGVALAALLLLGHRLWPGILVGAFLANYLTGMPLATACGIAAGNTLEALSGTYLLRRFAAFSNSLERLRDVIPFLFFAPVLSTAVSATLGVASLCLGGVTGWNNYFLLWQVWWLGDAMGALVMAPLLLTWASNLRSMKRKVPANIELLILSLTLIVVSLALFGNKSIVSASNYPVFYITFPFLIWAALRFGQLETVTAAFIVSVIAVWMTTHGFGPFVWKTQHESLVLLQVFVAVIAASSMILAAAIHERKLTQLELERARGGLMQEVQVRTAELTAAVTTLEGEVRERTRTQEILRASEQSTRSILDTASDAFVAIDQEGLITDWNCQAQFTFGWSREEALGRPLVDTVIPPQHRKAHLRGLAHFLTTGEGPILNRRLEMTAINRDGLEFPVELTIWPLRSGTTCRFNAFLHDISGRKQAEAEREKLIQELQRTVEKVKLLRGMLPICSWCKKVRDDAGYWENIESYLRDHSEAEFTHGICPACAKKLSSEIDNS